jgi:hypothetical protein
VGGCPVVVVVVVVVVVAIVEQAQLPCVLACSWSKKNRFSLQEDV